MESITKKKEGDNREDQLSGAHDWNRTSDLFLTKEVLYRLSYVSEVSSCAEFVNGAGGGNRTRAISLEG